MPFFSSASPNSELEAEIVRVTSELQTELKWDVVLSLSDKLTNVGSKASADAVKILQKRLNNSNPHIVLLTIELIDALMKNASSTFQKEACNLSFVRELKTVASCSRTKVAEEMRKKIKHWAENECKEDPALNLIPTLYYELRGEGYEFPADKKVNKVLEIPSDPDYVSSREEEDHIAQAIQASLKENKKNEVVMVRTGASSSNNLYPSTNGGGAQSTNSNRMVKALYDFEAAEDNEITFKAGDLISLSDDSDANWWRGNMNGCEGLFPASFVTSDLSATVESLDAIKLDGKSESVQNEVTPQIVVVDERKLDNCLELLEDADPTGERPDPPQLNQLERECVMMGPLIDGELANIDSQHNSLAEVDVKLREALALYDAAMNDASAQFRAQQAQQLQQPQPQTIPPQYQQAQGYSDPSIGQQNYAAQPVYQPNNLPQQQISMHSDPNLYNYQNGVSQQYLQYPAQ